MSISVMINNENFKLLQIKNKLRVTYRVIGFLPVDIDCSVIGIFFFNLQYCHRDSSRRQLQYCHRSWLFQLIFLVLSQGFLLSIFTILSQGFFLFINIYSMLQGFLLSIFTILSQLGLFPSLYNTAYCTELFPFDIYSMLQESCCMSIFTVLSQRFLLSILTVCYRGSFSCRYLQYCHRDSFCR